MTIKFHELTYSLKIWLTTLLFVPMVFIIMVGSFKGLNTAEIITDRLYELALLYLFIVLFAGMISFFIWVIFYYLLIMIVSRIENIRILKYISATMGVILVIGVFVLLSVLVFDIAIMLNAISITFLSFTCFGVVSSSMFYKLYTITECETEF